MTEFRPYDLEVISELMDGARRRALDSKSIIGEATVKSCTSLDVGKFLSSWLRVFFPRTAAFRVQSSTATSAAKLGEHFTLLDEE